VKAHRQKVVPGLRDLAIRAVDQVAGDSELKELWQESDEMAAWADRVQELRGRLDH
jgi:hypothetical protein